MKKTKSDGADVRGTAPGRDTPGKSRQSLRIIGGQWRGRRFDFVTRQGLRPTLDRFRETLFNWLMHDVDGAVCLDAFAGSGALGLEALSRYAQKAVFIEKAPDAANYIREHLKTLQCDRGQVVNTDTLTWLKAPPQQAFDLVFLDPPFGGALLEETCTLLTRPGWLKTGSLIYIETEDQNYQEWLPDSWQIKREKVGKNIRFLLLVNTPDTPQSS